MRFQQSVHCMLVSNLKCLFLGPGLAIRILCAHEAHMEKDFAETQVLCRLVVNFAEMAAKGHALLNRIENITTDQERSELKIITGRYVHTHREF